MKTMKKLLVLLLALVMLLSLCACGDKSGKDDGKKESSGQTDKSNNANEKEDADKLTDAKLQGDWTMTLNANGLFALMGGDADMETFAAMDGVDIAECVLDVNFKDGKMTLSYGGMLDWYRDAMEKMLAWVAEGDNVYLLMADETMTPEEAKAFFDEMGMDRDTLIETMTAETDVDELLDAMSDVLEDEISNYELDGDKLYTWNEEEDETKSEDEYFQFTYADGIIRMTKTVEYGEAIELNDGDVVFKKK